MRFIGCKTLLLDHIEQIINENIPNANSFCDIFSGTATVGRYFKKKYEVLSNDLLYFSYVLQKATIVNDKCMEFKSLGAVHNIQNPIEYFNQLLPCDLEQLPQKKRFFQNTYAPTGGRMYLSDENALRIDYARNVVEEWFQQQLLTEGEYFYLVACIVEGIPFISNISGTYGAFHKTWDKRALKKFELYKLDIVTNGKNNQSYNLDGVELVKNISGDILYIDPPYNARQYLPNYHVLETAAKYDFPNIRGLTAQRPYEDAKSTFCTKKGALNSFSELIKHAQFKYIIMSYSTDGIMNISDIEKILKQYGKPETFKMYNIPYRRYKSRELKVQSELKELLLYIENR